MTDFLTELQNLFKTFEEKELMHLKQYKKNKIHESLLEVLQSSLFFMKEYTQQKFKKSNRFKEKTYYNFRGYPVKLNTTKEMKLAFNFKVKKKDKQEPENFSFDKLKSSEIKVKELILFTQGSRTKSQFECWTPMEMFLWWRTLRESSYPKREWTIMDAVFFLFINQISQIINTYVINFYLNFYSYLLDSNHIRYITKISDYKINKYEGADDKIKDPYLKSLFYLKKYLEELDKFYKSGGEYGLLLDVQLLYYEYYEFELHLDACRHYYNDSEVRLLRESKYAPDFYLEGLFQNNNETVHTYRPERIPHNLEFNNIKGRKVKRQLERHNKNTKNKNLFNIFQETLKDNNYSLIIFLSYFQIESKYISLYSIPVIPVLGLEYDTHEGRTYTSLDQIRHDLGHSNYLIYFLENLYLKLQKDEDIQEFFRRTIFLEELNKKALEEKMKLIKDNENNDFSIKRIYKGTLNANENKKFKESEEKNSKKLFISDSQKLLWWFLHEKKFNLNEVGFSDNIVKEVAINFFDIKKLKKKLQILIKHIKSDSDYLYRNESGKSVNIRWLNKSKYRIISPIGFLRKKYFNKHGLDIELYKERVIRSINILIEICDFVLGQEQRYNNNNKYERGAIYENNNRNNLNNTNNTNIGNKYVKKFLEKHPDFTNQELEEYASDYKIKKFYDLNTNNKNHINSFRKHFIKRVINAKIIKHIQKYINNHQDLTNEEVNNLSSLLENKNKLEELKKKHNNKSNLKLLNILLQNFSNQRTKSQLNNPRNPNNT
jgi:hypothetical protein